MPSILLLTGPVSVVVRLEPQAPQVPQTRCASSDPVCRISPTFHASLLKPVSLQCSTYIYFLHSLQISFVCSSLILYVSVGLISLATKLP